MTGNCSSDAIKPRLWLVFFFVLAAGTAVAGQKMPFVPGERLVFALSWGVIPAGTATLEVGPMANVNGQDCYHFILTAESNDFVDIFYKVRDRIESFVDTGMTRSLLYTKKQREGSTHRDVTVFFDWDKKRVQRTNFDKFEDSAAVSDGCFDPLSAFYFARMKPLNKDRVIERPVTDGKKVVIGKATVLRRETLVVGNHRYDTFLLQPELKHVGGVFEKSKNANIHVWVTADARRIPVKVQSKVAVGSFVGELIAINPACFASMP
jgi:hypothetical protein